MTHLGSTVPRDNAAPLPERAEFYVTLARAFLPPTSRALRSALVEDLPDAIEELVDILALPLADDVTALRKACAVIDADGERGVLLAYSRLFLTPPVLVPLNAGMMLDGAVMGPTTREMEEWYAHYGVKRDEAFFDLPDHLSMQLEFLSVLLGRGNTADDLSAMSWARKMLLSWTADLADRITAAEAGHPVPAHPYQVLARILHKALLADFQDVSPLEEAVNEVVAAATGEEAPCIKCGATIGLEGELANVERILSEKGLPTAHLRICPDCRDGAQGYSHKPVPGVDRLSGKTPPRRMGG